MGNYERANLHRAVAPLSGEVKKFLATENTEKDNEKYRYFGIVICFSTLR